MERLIAWYRVGSSVGAVVALLVANAIPLVGVLFLGWNVWTILTIYWLENGVVGVFNVLKMAKAAGPEPTGAAAMLYNGRPVVGGAAAKASLIPFFVMHYGIFWVVHGIFVLTLPEFEAFGGESAGLRSDPARRRCSSSSAWSSATACRIATTTSGAANTCGRASAGRWPRRTGGSSSST